MRPIAKNALPLLIGASLLSLSACNEFVTPDHKLVVSSKMAQDMNYHVEFKPINSQEEISGHANIKVSSGKMMIESEFHGVAAEDEVMHPQNIRMMSECPTITQHDTNKDNYIDAEEGRTVYGDIMISLDEDLTTKERSESYPKADRSGSFFYTQSASLEEMKHLFQDESMNLSGKVLVIEGVSSQVELPETVMARAGMNVHQTLPVACGKIMLVGATVDDNQGPGQVQPLPSQTQVPTPVAQPLPGQVQRQRRVTQQQTTTQTTTVEVIPEFESISVDETNPGLLAE